MQPVERAEYEGIDYAWVMQTTFVVTILVGAPVAALLSTLVALESWGARAAFAVRVGAPVWFVTAVAVALYARRAEAGDGEATEADGDESAAGEADEAETEADEAETETDKHRDVAADGPPAEATDDTADDPPAEAGKHD
ncbi:DUF5822 domain-containing protein [Halorubrum sp. BOL3-1]|uniref:DUF5822 domain-containing protein n=1 Tax=Halorubrum sp. BOL3-1 TaxID=2497325 RepID=UPI001F50199C|nr:DUF5822 domain-containing protein [Halorubrum sp. BOL3-1]